MSFPPLILMFSTVSISPAIEATTLNHFLLARKQNVTLPGLRVQPRSFLDYLRTCEKDTSQPGWRGSCPRPSSAARSYIRVDSPVYIDYLSVWRHWYRGQG